MQALGNYRLTNPRRLIRGVAALALALGLSFAGISGSVATSDAPVELQYLTVAQGDTLWSLVPRRRSRNW
jgi:hypothetical protein